ncbi:MAG TPA: hypothetical protein VHA78_00410 [Candidatus Peribacteraceae bacterium]|nr:hypothetical protein [Candidatus Peribacteraceae bacterium]
MQNESKFSLGDCSPKVMVHFIFGMIMGVIVIMFISQLEFIFHRLYLVSFPFDFEDVRLEVISGIVGGVLFVYLSDKYFSSFLQVIILVITTTGCVYLVPNEFISFPILLLVIFFEDIRIDIVCGIICVLVLTYFSRKLFLSFLQASIVMLIGAGLLYLVPRELISSRISYLLPAPPNAQLVGSRIHLWGEFFGPGPSVSYDYISYGSQQAIEDYYISEMARRGWKFDKFNSHYITKSEYAMVFYLSYSPDNPVPSLPEADIDINRRWGDFLNVNTQGIPVTIGISY